MEPKYLYRAVDSTGQTIDFLLTAKRDAAAAKRFFRKALSSPGNPVWSKYPNALRDQGLL